MKTNCAFINYFDSLLLVKISLFVGIGIALISNTHAAPIHAEIYAYTEVTDIKAFDSSGNIVDAGWLPWGNESSPDAGGYIGPDAQVSATIGIEQPLVFDATSSNPDDYFFTNPYYPEENFYGYFVGSANGGVDLPATNVSFIAAAEVYYFRHVYFNSPTIEDAKKVEVTVSYSYGINYINDNAENFEFSPNLYLDSPLMPELTIHIDDSDFLPNESFNVSGNLTTTQDVDRLVPWQEMFGLTFFDYSATLKVSPLSPSLSPVPVPAAFWLFGSALTCLFASARRRNRKLNQ